MGVLWHLIAHRFLEPVASLMATLSLGDHKRLPCSTLPGWSRRWLVHRMIFGPKQGCIRWVLICLMLGQPPVALSQEVDEGEFSPAMLRYKLQGLSDRFEQAERKLSTRGVAKSTLKKLEYVHHEIECLQAEFQRGRYYPDLLDEQIVIVCEQLRLTLVDPVQTTSMSPPAS